MSSNEIPQGPQEDPQQRERMGALEGIKSQLANLRAAVERPQESAENADESQSAAQAFEALAGAMERARALHAGLEDSDPNRQAWLNVEEDILGSPTGVDIAENLASGLEDAVEQTDAAQEQLAALAGDFDDELSPDGKVQEYLDRFRLTPDERVENAIERGLAKAKENPEWAPIIAKAESFFRTVGIDLGDVLAVVKDMVFSKLEGLPVRVGMVEDARLNQQLAQMTDAQKLLVTEDVKQEWRQAYSRWASNPLKVFSNRPYIKVEGNEVQIVEPSEELVAEAPAQETLFGVNGLHLNETLSVADNPGISLQVNGDIEFPNGNVRRKDKPVELVNTRDSSKVTIASVKPISAADPGQVQVALNSGETIMLQELVGHLDRIEDQRSGEAAIEFSVTGTAGTSNIRASRGQA